MRWFVILISLGIFHAVALWAAYDMRLEMSRARLEASGPWARLKH